MKFLEIISEKKFTLITIFLFLYLLLNLFDGERGLISYYKKQNTIKELNKQKIILLTELTSIEKKNSLLTEIVGLRLFRNFI